MAKEGEIKSLSDLQKASGHLFDEIIKAPGSYDTGTNHDVALIHQAWELAQRGEIDSELAEALKDPESFVQKVSPKTKKVGFGQMVRNLGQRIGIYMETDVNDFGIQRITKKGRFASDQQPPQGDNWVKTESDEWHDTYATREVLEEAQADMGIDFYRSGFHATTSAILEGVGKKKALLSSSAVRKSGEQLKNGEVYGSEHGHDNVFVSPSTIHGGYGSPNWFDQFGVVFGISLDKQRKFLEGRGERILGGGSDGYEIGSEVPLENVNFIAAPQVHLKKVKEWAKQHCPNVKVVSREAILLKYKK